MFTFFNKPIHSYYFNIMENWNQTKMMKVKPSTLPKKHMNSKTLRSLSIIFVIGKMCNDLRFLFSLCILLLSWSEIYMGRNVQLWLGTVGCYSPKCLWIEFLVLKSWLPLFVNIRVLDFDHPYHGKSEIWFVFNDRT